MSSGAAKRARGDSRSRSRAAPPRGHRAAAPIAVADIAWAAAAPCAVLVLLAVMALGPPLGATFLSSAHPDYGSITVGRVHPEPTEQARFLLALTAPLLLAGLTVLLLRRTGRISHEAVRSAAAAVQWVGTGFVVICLFAQRSHLYAPIYAEFTQSFRRGYFTNTTLILSLLGAGALVAGLRDQRVRERCVGWARDTRTRRVAGAGVAIAAIVVWVLHAVYTEQTIATAHPAVAYHIQFTLDETYAVLNGRSPLVDFAAQYGSLWPYAIAAAMGALGKTIGVFTVLMATLSGLAMLVMFGVLRRVTRSPIGALLLFLPFLATSFFLLEGPLENRYTFANTYSGYPMRFALPWFAAWMTARHLDGTWPQRAWPLFAVAGLAAVNNTDHGLPAVAAVLAALLLAGGRPTRTRMRTLAIEGAAGLLGAVVLICALTLLRTGSLPDPALLFRFARLYGAGGFGMLPMPAIGFHLVIYLTFVAALGTATVRAIDGDADRLMTGMLAWCGTFGLLAGSYFAGRSHPEVLVASFGIWSFTVALLLVLILRRLAAEPTRWPTAPEAACLVGFLIAACSLAQTPTPWSQLRRLGHTTNAVMQHPAGERFVAAHARGGERVVILIALGHRIADDLGLTNVSPYTTSLAMPAREQLDDTIRALRAAGGRKVFLADHDIVTGQSSPPEIPLELERDGFRQAAHNPTGSLTLWVDSRN